jgi:magnesium-protoporphyrin O-methyltransferase
MSCSQCQAIEEFHNQKVVKQELSRYRKKGPDNATRNLIGAIQNEGIRGLTLLDIGGGVGGIQHALLQDGVDHATNVEASNAFLQAAREEAQRRNLADRVSYHYGNFVDLAETIPPADIVTLDKVICCYPDMETLVNLSADRARKIYGLVYGYDTRLIKTVGVLENLFFKITRNPFRIFVHPHEAVEAILSRKGFKKRFFHHDILWQVAVYTR